MLKLNDKSVAVTGGASGIGLAISKLFAQQGAQVHILELNETAAQSAATEIVAAGGQAFAYGCNVSDQQAVESVFEKKIPTSLSRQFSNVQHLLLL